MPARRCRLHRSALPALPAALPHRSKHQRRCDGCGSPSSSHRFAWATTNGSTKAPASRGTSVHQPGLPAAKILSLPQRRPWRRSPGLRARSALCSVHVGAEVVEEVVEAVVAEVVEAVAGVVVGAVGVAKAPAEHAAGRRRRRVADQPLACMTATTRRCKILSSCRTTMTSVPMTCYAISTIGGRAATMLLLRWNR